MKFLITGASGFIGSKVVNAVLNNGHQVAVVTRSPEKTVNLFGNKVEVITQEDFFTKANNINCDKVIHLAWADVQNYSDAANHEENIELQLKYMQQFLSYGIKDITVTGTCLEYGLKEGICAEDMPEQQPLTSYALAKLKIYNKFSYMSGLKWVRLWYVYGNGSRPNSLLSLLTKAIENGQREFNMSKGDQLRDFIHVDTLAHNIFAIAAQNKVSGIINNGNGVPKSVSDFVEDILAIKAYEMHLNKGFYPYPTYEPKNFWADITKLKSIEGIKFDDKIWL